MANSYAQYNGTGAQTNFVVTFPYLAKIDVAVQVGGVTTTAWTWVNATTIQITTPPPSGTLNVDIRRRTPIVNPLVVYTDGNVEFGADLNTTALQTLYALQEREDVFPNTTNINNVSADLTNIDAVALDLTNINLAAAALTNINLVAGDRTRIDLVAADLANIDVLAAGLPTKLSLAGGNLTGGINEFRSNITQHATTMDLFATAAPAIRDGTGSAVTITAIVNAPQAGPKRRFYPLVNTVITHGATFSVDGNATYTTLVGDCLEFEAITVSTYDVHIIKQDGNSITGKQTPGTTTNDAASAGNVGEFISASVVAGSAVALTNAINANVTSISLTAGDWDVSALLGINGNAATTISYIYGYISNTSATSDSTPGRFIGCAPVSSSLAIVGQLNYSHTGTRISLSATTTIYLVAQVGFAVNTLGAFGILHARRAR